MAKSEPKTPQELEWVAKITDLMDNSFRVPVLGIRFGLDPILGLIPGLGDATSFTISALLVLSMIRKGASGMLALKMVGNIIIDLIIGGIPLIGDIFDFVNKANRRNLKLMTEHYEQGKHKGSALPALVLIGVLFVVIWIASIYLFWQVVMAGWASMQGL